MIHRKIQLWSGAEAARTGLHPARSVVLLLLAALTVLGGFVVPATAHAATEGPGLRVGGVFLGAYISSTNASNAFCVEPDGDNPRAEVPATEMTTLRGYRMQSTGHWVAPYTDERGLRMMNYIASTYGTLGSGGTWQDAQGAAVALSIWTIRGWEDSVVSEWVAGIRANAPANVQALADHFIIEADSQARAVEVEAPEDPTVSWQSETAGTVRVPAGYQHFRLESGARLVGAAPAGATFESNLTGATLDPSRPHSLSFETLPELDSRRLQSVGMRASWTQSVVSWPARIWGFQPASDTEDQLLIAGGGGETLSDSGEWSESVTPDSSGTFQPVVTTQVAQYRLAQGEPYVDRVTFGLAEGSTAWPKYWADDAWHARPVRASGTLYGPFVEQPAQSDEAPAGAELPIAGTAVVEAVHGAGTYDVQIDAPEQVEAGYYTWVWTIDGQDQGPALQTGDEGNWHLDADYLVRDDYGLPHESHVRPMEFSIRTELDDQRLAPGGRTVDRITMELQGGEWLQREGSPVPVTLRATVYAVDGSPVRAPEAPPEARIHATQKQTITHLEDPIAVPVVAPHRLSGAITVQVCVLAEDQIPAVRDAIVERCDDWGVPEETAEIQLPEVSTRAQQNGEVDGEIHDVAIVRGVVPDRASLGFTAYLAPRAGAVKYDASWTPVMNAPGEVERWTSAELMEMSEEERCLAQPVATTGRVIVEGPGEYRSPNVIARSAGTVRWVEDLSLPLPKSDQALEVHRGRCGAAFETTTVAEKSEVLSTTGGSPWLFLGGGSALLLAGTGAVLLAKRRLAERATASTGEVTQ